MADNVNHPAHYESSTSVECIEAMELMYGPQIVYDFCLCNAYKYIWRHKHKNGLEDLNKARWYVNKAAMLSKDSGDYLGDEEPLVRLAWLLDKKEKEWQESH